MNLSHVTTLNGLHDAIRAFQGCTLKTGATRTVIGDGNPHAGIVLIGEAPGAEEDKQGIPFVGRSGKLLDQMLEAIGLSRQKVYITNTVFWRPPDNRTPTPAEVASCRPFLDKHLSLLAPKLVLLVGGTAAKTVLNTDVGIGKLRRQWHMLENPYLNTPIPALPTFHPAYLLRNPPAKKDAWEDLKMFRDRVVEAGLLQLETKESAA
ncbi:MAG: uracil-DNA glycosylase [Pseudomonadaceae bacterium]|nr:uracil-DNA glycosylase [Pseudomonadaceae bacterium]